MYGGEYQNVDLLCRISGVVRQVSEARNQASNGKTERMHRTVLNMASSMICGRELPLHLRGDGVEYSAYILNLSPTKWIHKSASLIDV